VPCRAVPCRAVPCRAVPCRAVPCRAVPCRAVPCRAVPCRAVLCAVDAGGWCAWWQWLMVSCRPGTNSQQHQQDSSTTSWRYVHPPAYHQLALNESCQLVPRLPQQYSAHQPSLLHGDKLPTTSMGWATSITRDALLPGAVLNPLHAFTQNKQGSPLSQAQLVPSLLCC
jgi:hypothetical protein